MWRFGPRPRRKAAPAGRGRMSNGARRRQRRRKGGLAGRAAAWVGALRAAVCEQSGRRRPRAVPASCGGSAGGPSDAAVALASPPGRCGPRQRVRASAGPRRASRGPKLLQSRRGLIMAATRRLRAPFSQEVFFVVQASRGSGLAWALKSLPSCRAPLLERCRRKSY